VLPFAFTIIHSCHSGTGTFSGDHCCYLSLDASAILGPGRSLKHPHGIFYCFVCFTPHWWARLPFLSIYLSLLLMEQYCGSPSTPPSHPGSFFCPFIHPGIVFPPSCHFSVEPPPHTVVSVMFIICSPHFYSLVSSTCFKPLSRLMPSPLSILLAFRDAILSR
jgi:hypothetical protein